MSARTLFIRYFRISSRPVTFIATRTFVASAQQHKTFSETVKDAAKTVDKTVSQVAIKGLEGVEKVNEIAKDAADKVGMKVDEVEATAKSAAAKTKVKGEQAKGKAEEGIGDAADNVKEATR